MLVGSLYTSTIKKHNSDNKKNLNLKFKLNFQIQNDKIKNYLFSEHTKFYF